MCYFHVETNLSFTVAKTFNTSDAKLVLELLQSFKLLQGVQRVVIRGKRDGFVLHPLQSLILADCFFPHYEFAVGFYSTFS